MNILAVNPWIYDFAAYDFWLKPYGFLVLLTYLKNKGVNIDYIDCLNKKETRDNFARGKYYSEIIKKPQQLKSIPRYFSRYGIRLNEFREAIKDKKPDLLKNTGFTNPHFGLETLNSKFQKEWGDKITTEEAIKGINFLTGKMHLKNTWICNELQTRQL
ncbi:MAG: radical SAM protein [Candidatus Omnitrophica bacterium]|nr:radical SAM protein [Candidatus Omnitrophota bacterium]